MSLNTNRYYYDTTEINYTMNYINKYTPINLKHEFHFKSNLIKHKDHLYFWTYTITLSKPNTKIKEFIKTTNIGLPIELNTIIASFIPDYREVELQINMKAQNQHIHWTFNSLECNVLDIQTIKYNYIKKQIHQNINDFLNKKRITHNCPCIDLNEIDKKTLHSYHYNCDGFVSLKKFYSEHFLLDHLVNSIKEII
jgi:hypothetical protein